MVLVLLKRTMAARSVQAAALVAARPMVTSSPDWLGLASKLAVKLVVCVGNATLNQDVVWATIVGAVKVRFKADEPVPIFPAASVAVAVRLCAPAASAAVI